MFRIILIYRRRRHDARAGLRIFQPGATSIWKAPFTKQAMGLRAYRPGRTGAALLRSRQVTVAIIIRRKAGRPRDVMYRRPGMCPRRFERPLDMVLVTSAGAVRRSATWRRKPLPLRHHQSTPWRSCACLKLPGRRRHRRSRRRRSMAGLARTNGAANLTGADAAGDVGKHLPDLLHAATAIGLAAKAQIHLPWRTRTRCGIASQRFQHLAVGQLITGADDHRVL